jgi:hypothetical protein
MADSDAKDDRGVWRLYSAGLYMRADAGEAGKLALLADVVRWLMSEGGKALPRAEAVEQLCAALEDASPEPELFRARPDTRAILLQGDAALFGFHTVDTWAIKELERECQEGNHRFRLEHGLPTGFGYDAPSEDQRKKIRDDYQAGRLRPTVTHIGEREPHLCAPGVKAAARYIRKDWIESCMDPERDPIYTPIWGTRGLSVRASVAHSLWGWGGVDAADASPFQLADYAALVKHRKANPGSDWGLGNHIEIGKAEVDRLMRDGHGKTSALKNMAVDIGCFRQSLERSLYSTERKRKRPAPETPATGSVIRMPRDRRNAA